MDDHRLASRLPRARTACRRRTAPGRVATRARTPYVTATVAPVAAPRPAAAKAQAAAPSRRPQPARLNGIAATTRTASARAASRPVPASTPAARAATTKTAAWPAAASAESASTGGTTSTSSQPRATRTRTTAARSSDSPERCGREGQGGGRRRDRPGDQDHEPCQRDLHRLADHPLGHHRPHRPVRDAAVHVAEHAAGQHGVEELGPVVRRDRRAQRHPDAVRPADQAPALRARHGRQRGEAERRHDRRRVRRPPALPRTVRYPPAPRARPAPPAHPRPWRPPTTLDSSSPP